MIKQSLSLENEKNKPSNLVLWLLGVAFPLGIVGLLYCFPTVVLYLYQYRMAIGIGIIIIIATICGICWLAIASLKVTDI